MIALLTNERLVAGIDNDQVVLTNQRLTEATQHPYSLAQLKGRQIILPHQQKHYPAQEALEWHRMEVFKG